MLSVVNVHQFAETHCYPAEKFSRVSLCCSCNSPCAAYSAEGPGGARPALCPGPAGGEAHV